MSVAKAASPPRTRPNVRRLKSQRKRRVKVGNPLESQRQRQTNVGNRGEPGVDGNSFISVSLFASMPYAWAKVSAHRVVSSLPDRKSTRLNSSHLGISYAVF